MAPYIESICCVGCGAGYAADSWQQDCACGGFLSVRYDYERIGRLIRREDLASRPRNIWRFRELLPIPHSGSCITLGEGCTPMIPLVKIGEEMGLSSLFLKDEGRNPTGTFKDRGAAVGVSAASHFGIRDISVPTMGSAGTAWSAYGAAAGIRVHVSMPAGLPPVFEASCRIYGADVDVFHGDFARESGVRHREALVKGWASATTLREPYRLEGKKTLLYEIAEDFGWRVPDVILCPTGGGVQVLAIWKAYQELLALGWIDRKPLRLVVVQAEGVAPIVRAWEFRQSTITPWPKITTIVPGFMVSNPKAGPRVLQTLAECGGMAIAIGDEAMFDMASLIARTEGLHVAPEGAGAIVAVRELRRKGFIGPEDQVTVINTATGLRYMGAYDRTTTVPAGETQRA